MGFKEILAGALGKKPEEAQNLSDEDLATLLAEVINKPSETPADGPKPNEPKPDVQNFTPADVERVLNDIRGLNTEAARQKMTEVMDDLRASNAQLQDALRLNEAHARVKSLSEGSRGYIPNIPQQEELLKILHEAPKPIADRVFSLFKQIKEKGLVELTERGRVTNDIDFDSLPDNPKDQFLRTVELAEKQHGITFTEALSRVSSERPDLYAKYRNAVDINAGVNG